MKNNHNQPNKEDKLEASSEYGKGFVAVFATTFTTVFLAELGDKTQLATMLLTAQSGQPLIVFMGAALALISSSLVSVLLGRWLSKRMPPERFNYLAGILMISIGLLLGIQSIHSMSKSFN